MNRPFLTIAAVGVVGFAAWKLVLPLVGLAIGLVFTVVKLASLAGLIWLVYWLITRDKGRGGEAPAS